MSLCASGILMATFTTGLLLSDLVYSRSDRLIYHFFVGSVLTFLCFMFCEMGYEVVIWVIVLIIPLYMAVSLVLNQMSANDSIKCGNDKEKYYYACTVGN